MSSEPMKEDQLGAVEKSPSIKTSSQKISSNTNVAVNNTRRFYPGDIVVRKNRGTVWEFEPRFGTVMKPANGSDLTNSIDYGTSKSFHVMWESNNQVEMTNKEQVGLADRLLLRNMRVANSEGVSGTITNVKVTASVQIVGTNHVVEKVTLDRLRPITTFVRGQEILYKNWVGVVTVVKRNVWFMLDGGMGFHLPTVERDGFVRTDPYWGQGVTCPGIRTKVSAAMMKKAKWSSGSMRFFCRWIPPLTYLYAMAPCTINKTEVTEVDVKWLQVAPGIINPEMCPQPGSTLTRDKLHDVTIIGMPSSETVGINSVRMLRVKPEDALTTYSYWLEAFKNKYIEEDDSAETKRVPAASNSNIRALASERVYEVPVKVLLRQSIVDVEWSDGNVERIHAIKIPVVLPTRDDSEYPKGMVVAPLYKTGIDADRYGVVQDSDILAKDRKRKVYVKWIDHNGSVSESVEESIFDLKPHPSYSLYQRGTIVFPRNPAESKFKSAVVSDLNVTAGKMVIVVPTDQSIHESFAHTLTPLPQRCFWNFFSMKWITDYIIPPPYQLECEFDPKIFYPELAEPTSDILTNDNNNPEEPLKVVSVWDEPSFELVGFAPKTHRFYGNTGASDGFGQEIVSLVDKEFKILSEPASIPEGIWIRSYENRLDLLSVLMVGPAKTPYEDGIFLFDLQLTSNFPVEPPKVHYISYSYELSPVMSWDGNFCVSALEWDFKKTGLEPTSYILNFVIQIQGLVFASEPYFCDTRKLPEQNTPKGKDISRMYNEQAFLRVLDSAWNMIHHPHEPWTTFIKSHFTAILPEKLTSIGSWDLTTELNELDEEDDHKNLPDFPLVPASEGFQDALQKRLQKFRKITPSEEEVKDLPKAISVTDVTADSESASLEAPGPDITIELVEPMNANQETTPEMASKDPIQLEVLSVEKIAALVEESLNAKRPETPQESIGATTKKPETPQEVSTPLDSLKNIVKQYKKGRKGKKKKGSVGSGSSISSNATSDTDNEAEKLDTSIVEVGLIEEENETAA